MPTALNPSSRACVLTRAAAPVGTVASAIRPDRSGPSKPPPGGGIPAPVGAGPMNSSEALTPGLVGGGPVDRGHLAVGHAQVDRELTPMVDGVGQEEPQRLAAPH